MDDLKVVLHGKEFRDAFLDLMATRFSAAAVDRKRQAWEWLFSGPVGPAGRPAQVFTVERKGHLAGAFLLIPSEYVIDGQTSAAMHPIATVTHPDHVGVGPLMMNAQMHIEGALAIGVPNRIRLSKAYTRYDAMIAPARTLRRRVHRPGSILARRGKIPGPFGRAMDAAAWAPIAVTGLRRPALRRDEQIATVAAFDRDFDAAWAAAAPSIEFAQARSAAFLTWRYKEMPLNEYETLALRRQGRLIGYAVTAVQDAPGGRAGRITDVFAYGGAMRDYALLLAAADARLRSAGCAFSEVSFANGPTLDEAARRSGFLWRKDALPLIMRHDIPAVNAKLPRLFERMHFCRGDHDEDY